MTREELSQMDDDALRYLLGEVLDELAYYASPQRYMQQAAKGAGRRPVQRWGVLEDSGKRARKTLKRLGL